MQTLLKRKLFGAQPPGLRPLRYKFKEWREQHQGKERALRLLTKTLLGVPSAHQGDQHQPLWHFGFDDGGILAVSIQKGNGAVALRAHLEEESVEVREAVDFLLSELGTRLRQV